MALDPTALFTLSYGLYVLTAREDGRDCGCIVNTVTQLTENPTRIALSVNKQNFTNEVDVYKRQPAARRAGSAAGAAAGDLHLCGPGARGRKF